MMKKIIKEVEVEFCDSCGEQQDCNIHYGKGNKTAMCDKCAYNLPKKNFVEVINVEEILR